MGFTTTLVVYFPATCIFRLCGSSMPQWAHCSFFITSLSITQPYSLRSSSIHAAVGQCGAYVPQARIVKDISRPVSTQQSNTCALSSVRVCCSSWPLRAVQSVQPEDLRHPPARLAVCPLAICLSTWKIIMKNFGNLFPPLDHHHLASTSSECF